MQNSRPGGGPFTLPPLNDVNKIGKKLEEGNDNKNTIPSMGQTFTQFRMS